VFNLGKLVEREKGEKGTIPWFLTQKLRNLPWPPPISIPHSSKRKLPPPPTVLSRRDSGLRSLAWGDKAGIVGEWFCLIEKRLDELEKERSGKEERESLRLTRPYTSGHLTRGFNSRTMFSLFSEQCPRSSIG